MSGWRPVTGYEGRYEVSAAGEVRKKGGAAVGQWPNGNGYMLVRLSGPRALKLVHRLVAKAFVPNPEGLRVVNHLNHNRADNRANNLEWCTQAENLAHARRHGRMQDDYWVGRRSPNASLTDDEVRAVRAAHSGGEAYSSIGRKFGISKRAVGRCVNRETYRDV